MAAGDAPINSSASELQLIIPSSDNVHGQVGFSTSSTSVSEDIGTLDITVSRTGGLEGNLLVNYTAEDGGAISPNDYQLNRTCECLVDIHM